MTDDANPQVELVNLTTHPVHLVQAEGPGPEIVLPAGTGQAVVTEPSAGHGLIRTPDGPIREVRLRRSKRVAGLPQPRPGVLYLVPRLTALAALDRTDLVFPHEEQRNADGVVVGAGALGRFEPPPRTPSLLRLTMWVFGRGRTLQGWTDVPAITRWVGVLFSVATAIVGAALGTVPAVVYANRRDNGFWPLVATGVLGFVIGFYTLWVGVRLWRHRETVLRDRGSVYVVDELADAWTPEEKRGFLAQLSTHFPEVLRVPGPGDLCEAWSWPLEAGAEQWNRRTDELVRSFWAVHYNDDPDTDNSVLIWAWWSVAVAFGARVTACRRGLALHVRRRPTFGRAGVGVVDADGWREGAHTFVTGPIDPDVLSLVEEVPARRVRLTVTPRPGTPAPSPASSSPQVTILLVRMHAGPWTSLTPVTAVDRVLHLTLDDAAGIGVCGTVTAELLEWRALPGPAGSRHPWSSYPSLARAAVEWIDRRGGGRDGVVLLATLIPQEVGVGIGVLAATRRATQWPAALWPLHVLPGTTDHAVVPGLDLGWRSLHRVGSE